VIGSFDLNSVIFVFIRKSSFDIFSSPLFFTLLKRATGEGTIFYRNREQPVKRFEVDPERFELGEREEENED
jgi:membrane glycosyltransferase